MVKHIDKIMQDKFEEDLKFVLEHYAKGRFDPEKAICRFHKTQHRRTPRRWWAAVAAAFATVFVLFAGGYSIYTINQKAQNSQLMPANQSVPQESAIKLFVFEDASLEAVLDTLSAHYGYIITSESSGKRLTATFPEDDIDVIVAAIEETLDVTISIER